MDDHDPDSLPLDVARQRILDEVVTQAKFEQVSLAEAPGRVSAIAIHSPIDVPGFRCSAMDGYAVRHHTLSEGISLSIAGKSLAGHPYNKPIRDNQCVQITTGAYIPDDLDTVVMQEYCTADGNQITFNTLPDKGAHVRLAGSNIARNACILEPNTMLTAASCGLMGSLGLNDITVLQPIRVGCFSTGDELIAGDKSDGPGMIHDANRPMLLGLLHQCGVETMDLGICRDTPQALRDTFERARLAKLDIVISTGGVSVGEADHVRDILAEFGETRFWKVAMKPGRPLTHGLLSGGIHFFGLPGNPVSGMVTFHQFVLPAIHKMQGKHYVPPLTVEATLTDAIVKIPGRLELQRGQLKQTNEGWQVTSTGAQDSHILMSVHRANCYIVLEVPSAGAAAGDRVQVIPFLNYPV